MRRSPQDQPPGAGPSVGGQAALERLGQVELIALLAMSMALAALGIDLLLPAFDEVRSAFALTQDNRTAQLITAYFLGLAVGQLAYGIAADRFGRRPVLFVGYVLYGLGALLAIVAPTFELLLATRVLWGLGAAGPRVVTLAVVRDTWSGEKMSRAMSFVMAVFITVPIISPTLGQVVVDAAPWRWVFGVCVAAVAVVSVWALRLPETLDPADRLPLSPRRIARAGRFVVSNRRTLGYMLALTSLYGVFTSWIASAEIIISDVFGRGDQFALIFGGLAAVLGLAMLVNARVVEAVGTRRLALRVMVAYVAVAVAFVGVALATGGQPGFWVFAPLMAAMLGSHALLIPNFNSLAMEPMGAVAGTASSVIGSTQIAVGALLGAVLDRAFDGTITPLALGFLGYGALSLLLVLWAERAPRPTEAETSDDAAAVPSAASGTPRP